MSRSLRMAVLACALLSLAACSTFRGRRGVDMAPFAENTLALVSDVQVSAPQPVYVRSFMIGQPDVVAARASGQKIRDLLRGITFYSLQVAAINSADLSEPQKASALARYLDEGLRAGIRSQQVNVGLTEAQLDSVLTVVRAQQTYLNALRAAEPMVTQVVTAADDVIGSFMTQVRAAQFNVGADVERDFGPHRANLDALRGLEAKAMHEYVLVSRARAGDNAAAAALRDSIRVPGGAGTSGEGLTRWDQDVSARLAQIRALRQQLQPEVDLYFTRMKELDEIVIAANTAGRHARAAIILWSRAHRNLAAGVALPPEIDVVGVLRGASSKLPGM